MLKMWGRNNSSNVQKAMWAVGELGLDCKRIDVGGQFGKTKEPPYSDMNPNALVPTLEEDDGFTLWESNAIIRYLARKHGAGTLEPHDPKARALANQWMDWQHTVLGPAIFPVFWGLVRTPPEKRDPNAIAAGKVKTNEAMRILDWGLGKHAFVAGETFSMGDIPVGVMTFRYMRLVPDRPPLENVTRWYGEIEKRPAFQEHVSGIPLT
ncbi:MAG: glutathione S-transferase family protein [Variibacter sp.]